MQPRHIVVIGTSSGGIEALRELVGALPETFAAPICIVMHLSPQSPGVLHAILDRSGPLHAAVAKNHDRLEAGRIYVAPPNCHLVVEPGRLRVTKGPRENRFRPAIDPLFRSAAQVYGPAAIGVILTGNLDDGTAGLRAIKQLGGLAIVQSPEDALVPSMPRSALAHVKVDHTVPLAEVAPLLVRVTSTDIPEPGAFTVPDQMQIEVSIAKEQNPLEAGLAGVAQPAPFACPECHGVLMRMKRAGPARFRCHTGHAYSVDSLLAEIGEGIEDALWNAMRALQEGELLLTTMAEHADKHHPDHVTRLKERAREAHAQAEALREIVAEREPLAVRSTPSGTR